MNKNTTLWIVIGLSIFTLLCCLCVAVAAGFYLFSVPQDSTYSPGDPASLPGSEPTPVVIRPETEPTASDPLAAETPDVNPPGHSPEPALPAIAPTAPVIDQDAVDTLNTLREAEVPINDVEDLARRLEGKTGIPATLAPPAEPYQTGSRKSFWVTNSDNNENFQVQATLRYVTPHSYFWIEDGVSYRERELRDLAETFESQIYPTNRDFFGSEWSPGVDGDAHLYILYTTGIGSSVAGYFSSNDSYNPLLQEYSNGHEMFVFNADITALDEDFTYGVLAHEFQHMIHWYRDRNEATWLNEGFSDLAMFLNGYDIGGHDYLYVSNPDLQLNDWPNDQDLTSPHYGASFLFMNYFLDRFGDQATQLLVAHPTNGLESIDAVLAELGAGAASADEVFADWIIASYLQDPDVGDGRFTYHNNPDAPKPNNTEDIRNCRSEYYTRDVRQYGVDYISLRCRGAVTLRFEGSTRVNLLPEDAHSGAYAFWTNKGDESDMTLTQTFDFRQHTGPLTLTYWTWYDIEEDFDYAYLLASTDGQAWEILHTPSGTASDPIGANYGWGYTGKSGGGDRARWVEEQVDLSRFAGQQVQLRFEYITDAAVNGEGLLIDDIAVPELGYFSDLEQDDGGWQASGFVRIQNALPQSYRLALILQGRETQVAYLPLTADNSAEVSLDFSGDLDEAVLVVAGTTRFTRQPAAYRFFFK